MAYTRDTWVDQVTQANAARLNNIEKGVLASHRQLGSKVLFVAAAGETQEVKDGADYVCDGTGDEVEINAALTAVASETIGYSTNGGKVILIGRQFSVAGPILMRTQTELIGAYGAMGTFIQNNASYQPAAAAAGLVSLSTTNTQYVTVRDLGFRRLSGNTYSGSAIYFNVAAGQEWDAFLRIEDCFIYGVGQDGIRLVNNSGGRLRGNMVRNVRILQVGGYGVYVECPDTFFESVDVGDATLDGFRIVGSNNHFSNCKAWYCNQNGFYLTGGRDNVLTTCSAQDNEVHGFRVGSPRTIMSACIADTNARPSGVTGVGFYVEATGFNIQGSASDRNEGAVLYQTYGVQFVNTPKGIANIITYQNKTGSSTGATAAGSVINIIAQ